LFGEKDVEREIFSEMSLPHYWKELGGDVSRGFSLLLGGHKLIFYPENERYQLYDISKDPNELKNLADDDRYKLTVKDLNDRLRRIRNEDFLNLPVEGNKRVLSDEEKRKLKALGYVE